MIIPRESHALTQDRKLIDRLWYKFFADFYARFERREQRPVVGQMYMHNNTTATVIADTTTFVKIAGTSTAGTLNEYMHTNGRLTNASTYKRKLRVSITGTMIAHQHDYIEFGVYDSTIGTVQLDSLMKMYIHHGTDSILFCTDTIIEHGPEDYIEVHLRDTTSVHNVTVERLNVVVTEI
jgi:hypothetical protein